MRDRETIDSELRRAALRRQSLREQGRKPSSREADELLDELLAHSSDASYAAPVTTRESDLFVPDAWLLQERTTKTKPRRRKGALRRVGLLAALPLSLIAIVAAAVVMLAVHHESSTAMQPEAQPTETPPSGAPAKPLAPQVPAPRIDVADAALVDVLKHEGVPVPSQEYVTAQGHAVCDFLAQQRSFSDAVGFVQRSSIWDANQSTEVAAGAIVAYCPQSRPAVADPMQPAYQNTLSDLQAIEGKLQGIQDDLHGIQGGLDGLPGHP
ncbi:DUF732 domain-containing protein [Mycobacterium stomatepiae]|uniref:DUF732 domain-containing protein n=1 Tax=Mycobacterium stomatepiae TaxID=470076 RepID=A0A7I7QEB9_9MYCO|nr:DUF732 domain-containing protein [Mycobacterium stomatepiae]MCV7167529.1 DUF732 domain-containing protein [Mycobacterium stomatepiae]BBY24367.1 hypothetical protein MSTO_45720 [Mycobacterium stomatepiae]